MSSVESATAWALARRANPNPGPVTAGWEHLTAPERGERVEWLRMLRFQAACEIADWVDNATPPLELDLDSPIRDALEEYRRTGRDLEEIADWIMARVGTEWGMDDEPDDSGSIPVRALVGGPPTRKPLKTEEVMTYAETARRLDERGITAVYTEDKIDGSDVATITLDDAKVLLDMLDGRP
jgi:hypothetical protein